MAKKKSAALEALEKIKNGTVNSAKSSTKSSSVKKNKDDEDEKKPINALTALYKQTGINIDDGYDFESELQKYYTARNSLANTYNRRSSAGYTQDAGKWYVDALNARTSLSEKRHKLLSYLDRNKDSFDDGDYTELVEALEADESGITEITDSYKSLGNYYSQFEDQSDYDKYVAQLEAYKQSGATDYEDYYQQQKEQNNKARKTLNWESFKKSVADGIVAVGTSDFMQSNKFLGMIGTGAALAASQYDSSDYDAALKAKQESDEALSYASQWRHTKAYEDKDFDTKSAKGLETAAADLEAYNSKYDTGRTEYDYVMLPTDSEVRRIYGKDVSAYMPTEQWTDDEKALFGYYYSTDKDKAIELGSSINRQLENASDKAEQEAIAQRYQNASTIGKIGYGALSVAEGVTPIGITDFAQNAMGAIVNGDNWVGLEGLTTTQMVSGIDNAITEDLNTKYGTIDTKLPVIGEKGWGDAYQLGKSIIDSMITAGMSSSVTAAATAKGFSEKAAEWAGKGVTYGIFFGNAAAQAYDDAMQRGATPGQGVMTGLAFGTAEALFEEVSLDHLMKINTSGGFKQLVKDVLVQAGIEGSEEFNTSLANLVSDALIMQQNSEMQQKIDELVATGVSYEDAYKASVKDTIEGLIYDAAAGAISGLLHSGTVGGISYAHGQGTLTQGDLTGTRDRTKVSAQSVYDMSNEFAGENTAATIAKVQEENANRTGKKADTLTRNQYSRIRQTWDEDAYTARINEEKAQREEAKAKVMQAAKNNAEAVNSVNELVSEKARSKGESKPVMAGQSFDVGGQTVTAASENTFSMKDGKLTLNATNASGEQTQLDLSDTENLEALPADVQAAVVYADTLFGSQAHLVLNAYDGKMSIETYMTAMDKAANMYEANGMDVEQASKTSLTQNLSVQQIETAKHVGTIANEARVDEVNKAAAKLSEARAVLETQQAEGKAAVKSYTNAIRLTRNMMKAEQSEIARIDRQLKTLDENSEQYKKLQTRKTQLEKEYATNKRSVEQMGDEVERIKSADRIAGSVSLDGGVIKDNKGNTIELKAVDRSKMTDKQKRMVGFVAKLSSIFDLDFVMFDGDAKGAQGAYTGGGTIYVNINAGMAAGKTWIAQAIGHELTHYMRRYAPTEYEELKQYIQTKYLELDAQGFEALVHDKMESGQYKNEDAAIDEIVANTCEELLYDSKAIKQLALEHMNLAERIRDFLKGMRKDLDEAFSEVDDRRYEAIFARQFKEELKELQDKWDKGIYEAVMNRRAEALNAKLKEIKGGSQFQTWYEKVREADRETTALDRAYENNDTAYIDSLVEQKKLNRRTAARVKDVAQLRHDVFEFLDTIPEYQLYKNEPDYMWEDEFAGLFDFDFDPYSSVHTNGDSVAQFLNGLIEDEYKANGSKRFRTQGFKLLERLVENMEADIADRWTDPGTDMNWNADFTQWYEARHPIEETPMENYRKGNEAQFENATKWQPWVESTKKNVSELSKASTDEERIEYLNREITVPSYKNGVLETKVLEAEGVTLIDKILSLKDASVPKIKSDFKKIAESMELFNKTYSNDAVEINFVYYGKGLDESLQYQNKKDLMRFGKMLASLEYVTKNAIPLQMRNDIYIGRLYDKGNTETWITMVGFYKDGNELTPVLFEIDKRKKQTNRLYITITFDPISSLNVNEIKKEETGVIGKSNTTTNMSYDNLPVPVSVYNLTELLKEVNPKSHMLLTEIPDAMLNEKQLEGKRAGEIETEEHIVEKIIGKIKKGAIKQKFVDKAYLEAVEANDQKTISGIKRAVRKTKYTLPDAEQEDEITYSSEVVDAYSGQIDSVIKAKDVNGKIAGTLSFSEYDGVPAIQMIEVKPEYRRRGIATNMLKTLQKMYPNTEIETGMTTPDGTKLLENAMETVTDKAAKAKLNKLKNVTEKFNSVDAKMQKLWEKFDNGELSEEEDEELHRLGDEWERLYNLKTEAEKGAEGLKATHRMVKFQDWDDSHPALWAVHNKSVSGLTRMLDRGGVPFPSIAVKKAGTKHTGFGDVSIVFPRSTIDPQSSRYNKLYSNDAWTPTEPPIEYETANLGDYIQKIKDIIGEDVYKDMSMGSRLDRDLVQRELKGEKGNIGKALSKYDSVKLAYLESIGQAPEITQAEKDLDGSHSYKNDQLLYLFEHMTDEELNTVPEYSNDPIYKRVADLLNEQFFEQHPEYKEEFADGIYEPKNISFNWIRAAYNTYKRNGNKTEQEMDDRALSKALSSVNLDNDTDYIKWVEQFFEGVITDSGIPNDKDLYTSSGNRRSFKGLHMPATMENIVREMRKQNETGNGVFGVNLRGAATKSYPTVESARAESGKLLGEHINDDEYDAIMKGFFDRLNALEDMAMTSAQRSSEYYYGSVKETLTEAIRDAKSKAAMERMLRSDAKNQWLNYSDELLEELWQLKMDVQNMPAPYFEAKPRRFVSIDEALAVIVPDDTDTALINRINDAGVEVMTYEKGNEDDRLAKLNSVEGAKFQTWEDGTKKSKGVQLDQQEALTRLKSENFQLEELVKQLTKERDKAVKEARESGRQLKLTRTNEVRRSDSDKLTNRLIRELGYTGDTEEKQQLRDAMKDLGDYIVNATGETVDYGTLKAKARAIAGELVSNANMFIDEDRTEETGARDRMDALHKELTGRTYRLPAADVGEIEQAFGSMKNFRDKYFGRFFVSETKGEAIDTLYANLRNNQLGDNWSDYLPEADSLGEMLLNIAAAVDRTERVYANPFRGNIEESTEAYANDIIFDMISDEVRQALPTFADIKEAQIGEAKAKGAEKARKAYELGVARLNALRAEKNARIAEVRQQGAAEKKAAVAKEKAEKWKAVAKERDYWRTREAEARAQRNESAAIKRYIKSINKDVKDLIDWSVKPSTKDIRKHVPAEIQSAVRDFVLSIDQSSNRLLGGGEETGRDKAMAKAMEKMRRVLDSKVNTGEIYSGRYDLPANFIEEFGKLTSAVNIITANGQGGYVLNNMSAAELKMLRDSLKALKKLITDMNVLHNNQMFAHAYEAGENSTSFIEKLGKAKQHVAEFAYKFMGFDNMRPVYVFDRFGEGGQSVFQEFVEGQDELAKLTDVIIAFRDKTYTAEQANEWANEMHEFEVNGEKITMSTAQLMSLYCLNRREQGKTHIFGEGFRVANTKIQKAGKLGFKRSYTYRDEGHNITQLEIGDMLDALTDEQKRVAEAMQEFMSTTCSGWGNYVTRIRFDVDGFTEPYYFPINSDGRILPANADEMPSNASLYALLNAGFTKELKENANNRIILYNIFDVFANHTASMAQYRSFALPVLDALKWFNYSNEETSLRDEMAKAFGSPEEKTGSGTKGYAESFVINFLKAINGTAAQGDVYDGILMNMLHNYNRAAIAFNGRVVIQQPMAITRAAMFLNSKDLAVGIKKSVASLGKLADEMEMYSGMAKWKALGFYDTNVSRGLTDMISYRETFGEKVTELGTKGAELADRFTWAAIWYAAKQSVSRSDYGTEEEYFEAVTKVFENVITRSQVVDSIVTKSEFLRAKGLGARLFGSFMSEPMTTISMLTDAGFRYELDMQSGMTGRDALKKNGSYIKATLANYAISQALLAVVQSLYDAWRDDDDYETALEKYLEALKSNMVSELDPLGKIPYIKEAVEVAKQALANRFGWDIYGNVSSSTWGEISNYILKISKIEGEMAEGESYYTFWGLLNYYAKLGSALFGYPFATVYREAKDLYNNTIGKWTGTILKTYDGGDRNNIKWAYQDGYLTEDEAADELIEKGEAETREEALKLTYGWDADGDSYGTLKQIVRDGTQEQFEAVKAEMLEHGFSEETIDGTVKRYIKQLYTDSSESYGKQDAIEALTTFAGYDSKTANDTVAYWWIMKEYGSEVDADGNGSVKMDELGEFLTKLIRSGEIDSTEAQSIWNGCNPSWKTTYSEWKKK